MFKNRPKKLVIQVVSGAAVLLIGGFDFYQQQNLIVAAVYIFAGVISISMLRKPALSDLYVQQVSSTTNAGLFLVNAIVLFQAGKRGLPYAWLSAAVFAAYSAFRAYKKSMLERPKN